MDPTPRLLARGAAALAVTLVSTIASAVYLNPDGTGQALIFPYYTVQSANGNPLNTYLSIANRRGDAKALRLRVREGRNGRAVASINLYLAAGDMWTAAIVPGVGPNDPPRLVSADTSCSRPDLAPGGLALDSSAFTGAQDDGNGTDADRLREGFVEVLEMGVLASGFAHDAAVPRACSTFSGAVETTAPTGGLSGTLTLINVANGMDFAVNAAALAQLASRPYFRVSSDPYPDFNAAEIDAWSLSTQSATAYRSLWPRPVDAVSAALMVASASGEYVLDAVTHSSSELVVTFPTRHFYVDAATASPPFSSKAKWTARCTSGSETMHLGYADREGVQPGSSFNQPAGISIGGCSATVPWSFRTAAEGTPASTASRVFGSRLRDFSFDPPLQGGFVNGAFALTPSSLTATNVGLRSLGGSQQTDLPTGTVTTRVVAHLGLPIVGFWVRTFENGTLACDAGKCQGNYGAAFPFTRSTSIVAAP